MITVQLDEGSVADLVAADLERILPAILRSRVLLKTSTAAAMLEVDESTFRRLMKARGVKPLLIGNRSKRWSLKQLDALLAESGPATTN